MEVKRYVEGNYFGASGASLTSTANKEIIQQHKKGGDSDDKIIAVKFFFENTQACTVKINGADAIGIPAGEGFAIDETYPPIATFVIVESGITYSYYGVAVLVTR